MRRIHKILAVGGASLLVTLALTPTALAAVSASGVNAGRALTLPNSNIKGTPAQFVPSQLTAKARRTTVPCTVSQASFTLSNKKGKSQTVTFSGVASGTVHVPAHVEEFICVRKGITGKLVGKLNDGNKLIVHLQ